MLARARSFLFGRPKDIHDHETFHSVSLVAMLAWVGLGADGLSSSAYGPDEAFRELVKGGDHTSLAVALALGTALTVFIISYAYTRIIEHFPSGGGGYVVATKLLGKKLGVVSGSALLVDYVLTITTSVASGGDAIFSMIPRERLGAAAMAVAPEDVATLLDPVQRAKLAIEIGAIVLLVVLNIRGIRESVTAIAPVFMLFVVTHVILLVVAIGGHAGQVATIAQETAVNYRSTVASLGSMGALMLFVRAYSLGGGTYTGIEAVSNGTGIMREPRVRTAKRTMVLMAASLAVTAGGILLAYLLVHALPLPGKTMNAVLLERVAGDWRIGGWAAGPWFVTIALASEAALLIIAAQAGFLDGPRVMASMAVDSWLPHRFAALSERLTMQNGVLLMGGTSIAALIYTRGNVSKLVVMYSINVFLTFSLSNLGMARFWIQQRRAQADWKKHLPVHVVGLLLCVTILVVTCFEKFALGGWLTLVITGGLVALCLLVKRHYGAVGAAIKRLDVELPDPLEAALAGAPIEPAPVAPTRSDLDPRSPIAVLFVGGYGGLGRHALLTLLRMFPRHFEGVVFCSIAVVDSGNFKGVEEVHELEARTLRELEKYARMARMLGLPAETAFATGTEVAVEAEQVARDLVARFPGAVFVAGQLLFEQESTVRRVLHNETALLIQQRLQRGGIPMIVLPVRIALTAKPRALPHPLASARP